MKIRNQTKQSNGTILVDTSDSSSIQALQYEPDLEILTVIYRRGTGKKYEYPNVPITRFNDIANADSLGYALSVLKKEQSI